MELPRSLLRRIHITTGKRANTQFAGQYRSAFKGLGLLFDGVREYQPGDDVKSIDWNVSARMQSLFVKEYIEERELSIVICADISASMRFGTVQSKREAMLEAAAVLMQCAALNNDRLSIMLFSDTVEKYIVPKKGSAYVLKLLNDICAWVPKGKGTNIGAAAEFLLRVLKKRSVIFVLSDFIDDAYLARMKKLSRRHDVIPVMVSDPLERNMKLFGLAAFHDLERGEVVYADAFPVSGDNGRIEGFDVMKLSTDTPAAPAVLEYFIRRNKKRLYRW